MDSNHPFTMHLFGKFEIIRADEVVKADKHWWSIAFLVLASNRGISRKKMAEYLWLSNSITGAGNLRNFLVDLRKKLGENEKRLKEIDDTLYFDANGLDVDYVFFEQNIGKWNDIEAVDEAINKYQGEVLEGCERPGLRLTAESLNYVASCRSKARKAYLEALRFLVTRDIERTHPDLQKAEERLRKILKLEPVDPVACLRLLNVLSKKRDVEQLQAAYENCMHEIRNRIKHAPVKAATKGQEQNLQDVETTSVPINELENLKKSISEIAPDLIRKAGTPTASRSLFSPLTSFVGRQQELADLRRMLTARPSPPIAELITLKGEGGIGKSRLAIAAAWKVKDRFSAGVAFVELTGVRDAAVMLNKLATGVELPEAKYASNSQNESGTALLDGLIDFLQPLSLLILLDNCEYLDPTCAGMLGSLLGRCKGLVVLATSRGELHVSGEKIFRVKPLQIPQVTGINADSLINNPCVQLFETRVKNVKSSFRITEENVEIVASICQRLDGLPLAIELAAARMQSMPSLDILLDRLNNSLDVLSGGKIDGPPHHRTVRATIKWSYDLLEEHEKRLFRRLSVFTGGWTLEAAENVCSDAKLSGHSIFELLTRLVDYSLVTPIETNTVARYRFLATIGEYSKEIDPNEYIEFRMRHLLEFIRFAQQHEPNVIEAVQTSALVLMDQEYENLIAALEWCQKQDLVVEEIELAAAMAPYWEVRSALTEGRRFLEAAIRRAKRNDSSLCLAKALRWAGRLAYHQSDFKRARDFYEDAQEAYLQLGDIQGHANIITDLGNVEYCLGDRVSARRRYQKSFSLQKQGNNKLGLADALCGLGDIASADGEVDEAQRAYNEAMELFRQISNEKGVATCSNYIGTIALANGHFSDALNLHKEALNIYRGLKYQKGEADTLFNLASVAVLQEDFDLATRLFQEAGDVYDILCNRLDKANVMGRLSEVSCIVGDFQTATARLQERLQLLRAIGNREHLTSCIKDYTKLLELQGDNERAAEIRLNLLSQSAADMEDTVSAILDGTPLEAVSSQYFPN